MHRTAGPMFSFSRARREPTKPEPATSPEQATRPEPVARPVPATRAAQVRAGSRRPRAPAGGMPSGRQVSAGPSARCPAAAAVRAALPSGSALMLCGHHGRRYAAALRVQGAVVTGDLAFPARRAQTAPVRAR